LALGSGMVAGKVLIVDQYDGLAKILLLMKKIVEMVLCIGFESLVTRSISKKF